MEMPNILRQNTTFQALKVILVDNKNTLEADRSK